LVGDAPAASAAADEAREILEGLRASVLLAEHDRMRSPNAVAGKETVAAEGGTLIRN
jgi:hypothetical protein